VIGVTLQNILAAHHQKAIADNAKFLVEHLEHGKSETLTAYLGAVVRFCTWRTGSSTDFGFLSIVLGA
jgi:hypothetical protein